MRDIKLPIYKNGIDIITDFGTIDIDLRQFIFNDISKHLSSWLFFKYTPLQKTLHWKFKGFLSNLCKELLIKVSNYGSAIPVHKFKERQDDHLVAMQDTVKYFNFIFVFNFLSNPNKSKYSVDRGLERKAISLVRDIDLGAEFDFFVKSGKLFESIPLYKFKTNAIFNETTISPIYDGFR